MATRIESKSRTPKRFMASATDTDGVISDVVGRFPRLDARSYPATGGVNISAVDLTVVEGG